LLTANGSRYASGMMLSFEEFRATRRRTDDAQTELGFDYDMEAMPAFVYADSAYIEITGDGYTLMMGRAEWQDHGDEGLARLEEILYREWYVREG
jgi:hypothetical protein